MKDNKLIAEFMGVDYVDIDTYLEDNKKLQYHTSWDWLMPVVNKCLITDDSTKPSLRWYRQNMVDALLTCNIGEMHNAVVEFINEHNKYICGSCGDHVNEVVFNEDADVDECTNCIEYYER